MRSILGSLRPTRAQFLVGIARLDQRYEARGQSIFVPDRGRMSNLCFAKDCNPELFGCAPRPEPSAQGTFYSDKFISLRAGDARGPLGRAEVKEAYVYDNHYRGDIDFTGLKLVLTLRQSAFERYERFIGIAYVPPLLATDITTWHGDLFVRVPAPLFEFPSGRGSIPPYPPAGAREGRVGKLRTIKNFRFDTIDIVKIGKRQGSGEFRVPDMSNTPSEHVLQLR